jgi:hypothetical protein
MQQEIELSIRELTKAYSAIDLLDKSNCKINYEAGYWLGIIKQKLFPIARSSNKQKKDLFDSLATPDLDKEGKELKTKSIKGESLSEYERRLEEIIDIKDKIQVKKIKHSLFSKENGTESLPASFWSDFAIHFITEPDQKQ